MDVETFEVHLPRGEIVEGIATGSHVNVARSQVGYNRFFRQGDGGGDDGDHDGPMAARREKNKNENTSHPFQERSDKAKHRKSK